MSDWTQLIETGFQKLSELSAKYGPQAIDTAAQVVRVDAAQHLTGAVIALAVAVGAAVTAKRTLSLGSRLHREYWDPNTSCDDPRGTQSFALLTVGCIAMAFGALAGLVFLVGLPDVWDWVALFDPKLALAAKVVHALPGMGQ